MRLCRQRYGLKPTSFKAEYSQRMSLRHSNGLAAQSMLRHGCFQFETRYMAREGLLIANAYKYVTVMTNTS
jgi:hypothetical protein